MYLFVCDSYLLFAKSKNVGILLHARQKVRGGVQRGQIIGLRIRAERPVGKLAAFVDVQDLNFHHMRVALQTVLGIYELFDVGFRATELADPRPVAV